MRAALKSWVFLRQSEGTGEFGKERENQNLPSREQFPSAPENFSLSHS